MLYELLFWTYVSNQYILYTSFRLLIIIIIVLLISPLPSKLCISQSIILAFLDQSMSSFYPFYLFPATTGQPLDNCPAS